MPLISTFWLSKKNGNETWIESHRDYSETPPIISYSIKSGKGQPPNPSKVGRGAQFQCVCCGNVASVEYIKNEGTSKRIGALDDGGFAIDDEGDLGHKSSSNLAGLRYS